MSNAAPSPSIVIGSRLRDSGLYAHGRGVVYAINSDHFVPGRISYDLVFEDGYRFLRISSASFSGPGGFPLLAEPAADADEIKGLLSKADARELAEREEKARAAAAFAAEVARLHDAPEFAHLKQKPEGGYLSTADISSNVRAHLKKHFKGVKFRANRYGSHDSITVEWTDGPLLAEVKKALAAFDTYAGMDPTGDYPEYASGPFNAVFGGVKHLRFERSYSDATVEKAIETIWPGYEWPASKPSAKEFNKGPAGALFPIGCSPLRNLRHFVTEHLETGKAA